MFKEYMNSNPKEKLEFFFENISITNRTPDYFINFSKVEINTKRIEISLNTLNYLVGKTNIKAEAKELFLEQPDLLKVIPALIASRDKELDILSFDDNENMYFTNLNFRQIDLNKIDEYIDFMDESGLLNFLENIANKSLVDYVYGVEAGLDSNARKNRSGSTMEKIVERNVNKICDLLHLEFRTQATSEWIYDNWGVNVPVDKSKRRFDIAVYDENAHKVYVLETNYYGGGGSKLKSVCGEFMTLNKLIQTSEDDVEFIWVTDGNGWKTAKIPLSEAFDEISNIFNLRMLEDKYLEELLANMS